MENTPFLRETYTDIYKFLSPRDTMSFRFTSRLARLQSPPLEEIKQRRQKEIEIENKYQDWIINRKNIYNSYWCFHDYIVTKYGGFKRTDITKELNLVTFRDYIYIYRSFLHLISNIKTIHGYHITSSLEESYVFSYLLSSHKIYEEYLTRKIFLYLSDIPKDNNPLENYFKNPPKQYKYTQTIFPILDPLNRVLYSINNYKHLSSDDLYNIFVVENYFLISHYGTPGQRLNRICAVIGNSLNIKY
jgi:hypothetical protein